MASFGLAISVSTRTVRVKVVHGTTAASNSGHAMRQHLDRDAVRWVPPISVFAAFEIPAFYPFVAPAGPPMAAILFDESLYNRPPPSC
ncbi:MAG TPA: hypothetical protein VFA85_17355 [Terriglobales bacterium]|nr:hypothetical protein [Terriglobales bacterium]